MARADGSERHYRTLEVDDSATLSEIRRAYRLLVKAWHPDRFVDDEVMRAKAEERLREINIAFEALKREASEPPPAPKKADPPPPSYPITPEPPPSSASWHQAPPAQHDYPRPMQTQFGYRYTDGQGRIAIPGPFSTAEEFSEGLAVVGTGRVASLSKFGYLDVGGNMRIPYQFDGATSFHDGLAAVRIRTAWGFIDSTGRLVIPPRFQMAQSFSEGLAAVREQGLWGYIDQHGRMVVPAKFASAQPFQKGWGVVGVGNRLAKVNARGEVMLFDSRYSR